MASWALITNGNVAQVVTTDPAGCFYPSLVWVSCPDGTAVGSVYNGSTFTAPTPPAPAVPQVVSMVQAQLALLALPGAETGKTMLDDVNAAVAASTDPRVAIAWKTAAVVQRSGVLMAEVAGAPPLSLSSAQLDALFIAAAQIVV